MRKMSVQYDICCFFCVFICNVGVYPGDFMKAKRLKARTSKHGFAYVFYKDIQQFHGEEWCKKYSEVAGLGNTCPVIEGDDLPEGYTIDDGAMYYWDYERFANRVDYGTPTYFD